MKTRQNRRVAQKECLRMSTKRMSEDERQIDREIGEEGSEEERGGGGRGGRERGGGG